jgi:hypothetical protein
MHALGTYEHPLAGLAESIAAPQFANLAPIRHTLSPLPKPQAIPQHTHAKLEAKVSKLQQDNATFDAEVEELRRKVQTLEWRLARSLPPIWTGEPNDTDYLN